MEIIVTTRSITTTFGMIVVVVTTHGTIPILEFRMMQMVMYNGTTYWWTTPITVLFGEHIGTIIVIHIMILVSLTVPSIKMIGGAGATTTMIHTVTTAMISTTIITIQIMGMEATAGITPTHMIHITRILINMILMIIVNMVTKNMMD
tara:strand:- start:4494 stop:4937 length:444 start_codon:yes stop_codon:yes gene_type:complete